MTSPVGGSYRNYKGQCLLSTYCETRVTVTGVLHGRYYLASHLCEVAAVINYSQIQVGKLRHTKVVQGHTAKASGGIGLNTAYKDRT